MSIGISRGMDRRTLKMYDAQEDDMVLGQREEWRGNVDCFHEADGRTYWHNYVLTHEFIPLP